MVSHRSLGLLGVVLVAFATACGDGTPTAGHSRYGDQRYEGSFTVLESPEHGPELCNHVLLSDPPQCDGLPVTGWDWDAVENEKRAGGITWGAWHVTGIYHGQRFTVTEAPGAFRPEQEERDDVSPACAEPDVVDTSHGGAEWEAMSQDFGPFEIPDLVAAWVSDPAGDWDGPFVGNVVVLPGTRRAALDRIREHYAGPLCVVEREGPTAAELKAVHNELSDDHAKAVLGEVQTASADERRGVVVAEVWVTDETSLDYVKQRWGNLVELRALLHPVG